MTEQPGENEPLRFLLSLHVLDAERAIYSGSNMTANITRACFDAEGKPIRVTLVVGEEAWSR